MLGSMMNIWRLRSWILNVITMNFFFVVKLKLLIWEGGFESGEELFVEGKSLLEASDGLATTQVLDHFDDEVVADSDDDNVTHVLEDNTELSDSDDLCSKAETVLSSEENRQHGSENNKTTGALDARSNEHGISGKVPRFASVRSAAFRASAAAARIATQKIPNSDGSTPVNCHSSGQGATHNFSLENTVGEVGNQQCLPSISVEKRNDLKTGNRTARKLFLEDLPEENCPSVDDNAGLGGFELY